MRVTASVEVRAQAHLGTTAPGHFPISAPPFLHVQVVHDADQAKDNPLPQPEHSCFGCLWAGDKS